MSSFLALPVSPVLALSSALALLMLPVLDLMTPPAPGLLTFLVLEALVLRVVLLLLFMGLAGLECGIAAQTWEYVV